MGTSRQLGSKAAALVAMSLLSGSLVAMTNPRDWVNLVRGHSLPGPLQNLAEVLRYLMQPFADLASWWLEGVNEALVWLSRPLFDLVVVHPDLSPSWLPSISVSHTDAVLLAFLLPSMLSSLVLLRDGYRARLIQRSRMAFEITLAWARAAQAPPDYPAAAAARAMLGERGIEAGTSRAPAPKRDEPSFAEAEAAARDLLAAMSVAQRKG